MSNRDVIVGIDLGGTRFRVCLAEPTGRILRRLSRPTQHEEGPERVVARLAAAVRELGGDELPATVLGVGVGAPGPLDPWLGVIFQAPNMPGWRDVPLRQMLAEALALPVHLGNDANLAALGETSFGAARGCRNVVYITVSTGIGGGVIEDNRLLLGARGLAAEVGHMVVEPRGPRCGCGNWGCVEALASGTAIARVARERLASGEPSALGDLPGPPEVSITAERVAAAAAAGDPLASAVMRSAAEYLGIAVVNVLHLYDPEVVVLGGGVCLAGEMIFAPVRAAITARAMAAYRARARVVPAALGDDAGLLGAVALVNENVDR